MPIPMTAMKEPVLHVPSLKELCTDAERMLEALPERLAEIEATADPAPKHLTWAEIEERLNALHQLIPEFRKLCNDAMPLVREIGGP